ncbi:MAG: HEAT repeat domain-containing protein [Anaerolineae bacterium]|nr:HEAT repeat domain-containing protein [Anaerolineae bacterium]
MHESDSFEGSLASLLEGELPAAALYNLSNLSGQDLRAFTDIWRRLPTERRRLLFERLLEIAEADFEVDFAEVFKIGMEDPDPTVRAAAIDGLWEVEDTALVRPTVRMLRQDPAIQVREAAALALSRFALMAELKTLQPRLAELVWEALWDTVRRAEEDVSVRRRAVEALAYFDRPEVTELIAATYEDAEPKMRISAIFAMGRSTHDRWATPVLAELESEDPEMRFEATRACGELRLIEATQDLSMLLTDPDPEVKLAAVWSLGQIGTPEARRVLEICLEQGNEAIQDAAEEALGWLSFVQGDINFPLYDFDPSQEDEDLPLWEDEEDAD